MSLRRYVNVAIVFLVVVIVGTVPIILQNNSDIQNFKTIQFGALLDLTNDHSVKTTIISYLVNRDKEPDDPIKIINQETLESDYKIIIELGAIRELNETYFSNQTSSSQMRFFTASYIDNSKPNKEAHLTGWIDEHRKVHEWDVLAINWVNSSMPHAWGMWIPFLDDKYCINKFIEKTSLDGYEYWDVTIGPVEVSELSESEGKKIRMFSAKTKWRNSTVYWPYAGYITEDREIHYTRLA